MSIEVMTWVWKHSKQQEGALLTLLALADWADDNGYCWPSIPMLATKARLSERQVFRVIRQLKYDGELLVEQGGKGRGNRSRYVIVMGRTDILSPKDRVTSTSVKGDIRDTFGGSYQLYDTSNNHQPSTLVEKRFKSLFPEQMILTPERKQFASACGEQNPEADFDAWKGGCISNRSRSYDWDQAYKSHIRRRQSNRKQTQPAEYKPPVRKVTPREERFYERSEQEQSTALASIKSVLSKLGKSQSDNQN